MALQRIRNLIGWVVISRLQCMSAMAGIIIQMQFSSIPTLIDAHLQAQLQNAPLKPASLFLYVARKTPFLLEDSTKIQLTGGDQDRINQGTNICLENVEVHIDYGKSYRIQSIELSSKSVIADVGEKETKLKNFELRVELAKVEGQYPLAISTFQYLRRLERQDLVRKHYKASKSEILAFIPQPKKGQKLRDDDNDGVSAEIAALDTESVSLLRKLLAFADKGDLFRVLLKKSLKDRQSKKSVRLSIIPTDVQEEGESFQIKKKQFNRNTIQELLSEYEAREERMRE